MRHLRKDVLVSGHGRIPAGTAEESLPAGVHIGNPKLWSDGADASSIVPPKSASKARWLEYAAAHGVGDDELGANPTKDQIVEILTVAGVPVE